MLQIGRLGSEAEKARERGDLELAERLSQVSLKKSEAFLMRSEMKKLFDCLVCVILHSFPESVSVFKPRYPPCQTVRQGRGHGLHRQEIPSRGLQRFHGRQRWRRPGPSGGGEPVELDNYAVEERPRQRRLGGDEGEINCLVFPFLWSIAEFESVVRTAPFFEVEIVSTNCNRQIAFQTTEVLHSRNTSLPSWRGKLTP